MSSQLAQRDASSQVYLNLNYLTSCWKTAKQENSDENKGCGPCPKKGHNVTTSQYKASRKQKEPFPAALLKSGRTTRGRKGKFFKNN